MVALFAALLLTAAFPANAATEKRVALVIGNSGYIHANDLPNPRNDAVIFAEVMREAGFNVVSGIDLGKLEMESVINEFTEKAYDADIALVFYAGHGMQVEGNNYLIPVDAKLTSPAHLKTRTVHMTEIIEALPADPAVGIIFMDACRDNPLARSFASTLPATRSSTVDSGLAAVQTSTHDSTSGGLLIGYATDPGSVALDGTGANSPYTLALARHLTKDGVSLQVALTRIRGDVAKATGGKQRPWYNASLGREIFLGSKEPIVATNVPAPPVKPSPDISEPRIWEIEQRVWDEVSRANTKEHYEYYLKQFPNGRFKALAELSLKLMVGQDRDAIDTHSQQLASANVDDDKPTEVSGFDNSQAADLAAGTAQSEELIGMNREDRKDLQLRLRELGFDPKGIDGALGRKSRLAIMGWQAKNSFAETSYLNLTQYNLLKAQSDPMMAAAYQRLEEERQKAISNKPKKKVRKTRKKRVAVKNTPPPPPPKAKPRVKRALDGAPSDVMMDGRVMD